MDTFEKNEDESTGMHNEIKQFSLVDVIIMDANVSLRHPVELQQVTEQLT